MEENALKARKPLVIFIFLIVLMILPSVYASPALNVTVVTDKQSYIPEENVSVSGNLTQNGLPVEGLVAIQINNPLGSPTVVRTAETGSTTTTGLVQIISVNTVEPSFPPVPKDKFERKKGELIGFNITVKNTDTQQHNILVIANAYDNQSVTLGIGLWMSTLDPNEIRSFTLAVPMSTKAYLGYATGYASVYTDWPKNGGIPYSSEVPVTYEIVMEGASTLQEPTSPEPQNIVLGTYNLIFKLSTEAKAGTYTIYVSSSYGEEKATNQTTFNLVSTTLNVWSIFIDGRPYSVSTLSNATISNLALNQTLIEISFDVSVPEGTIAFCNITIPNDLMRGDDAWLVLVDSTATFIQSSGNGTHTSLYFTYPDTATKIQVQGTWVVPEFPTFIFPMLLLVVTLVATFLARNRAIKRRDTTAN